MNEQMTKRLDYAIMRNMLNAVLICFFFLSQADNSLAIINGSHITAYYDIIWLRETTQILNNYRQTPIPLTQTLSLFPRYFCVTAFGFRIFFLRRFCLKFFFSFTITMGFWFFFFVPMKKKNIKQKSVSNSSVFSASVFVFRDKQQ